MKLKRRILSSAIALALTVQSVPFVIGYAEDQYTEESWNNEDHGVLKWNYDFGFEYINLKIDPDSNEVVIPSEVNGEEVKDLFLELLECPDSYCLNNAITLIIPESVERIKTDWFCYDNHIKEITLKYPSGESETIIAADLNDSTFSYLYDEKDDDYYLGIDLSKEFDALPTEYNGKKVDKLDLEHVHYSGGSESYREFELEIPAGFRIVNKHWKGSVTGIPEITLKYPSGDTEVLRSDDYDELVEYAKMALRENEFDEKYIEEHYKEANFVLLTSNEDHRRTNYITEDIVVPGNNDEIPPKDEDGIIRWFYNSDNEYIDLKIDKESYEVILPTEANGKKIEKLCLKDLDFSNNTILNKAPVIIIPEGMEVVDKNWKNNDTSIRAMYLLYPSGDKEALLASDINNTPFSYLYDPEDDDYYLGVNISCMWGDVLPTEYNGKKVSKIDLEHVYYSEAYANADLSLNIPDGISIVNKHWKGAVTGIAEITLKYPSGETEVLRSDDYNELLIFTNNELKKKGFSGDVRDRFVKENMILHLPEHPDHQNTHYPLENIDIQYISGRKYDRIVNREYADNYDITITGEQSDEINLRPLIVDKNIRDLNINITSEETFQMLFDPFCRVNNITINSENSGKVIVHQIGASIVKEFKELTIGENVELGQGAFAWCEELVDLNVDITKDICGQAFIKCPSLMKINNESPFNDDGSPKPGYKEFIENNFYDAENIGFLNKYTAFLVKQTVNETITDDMPDIVKLKAIHDKVCSMVYYDLDNMPAQKNHVDQSVFLSDSTVCDGYARAMNLMLHEAGIESCYVQTETHSWVIAKIGDHYFHVDTTWDDGDTVIYDWFMRSDSQIQINNIDHTNWELCCPSSLHSFQWNELPQCNDIMGDVDGNEIIDGRDASAILTSYARTSAGEKEEVDSILADFNFDGIVDGKDASAVLTYYSISSVDNFEY